MSPRNRIAEQHFIADEQQRDDRPRAELSGCEQRPLAAVVWWWKTASNGSSQTVDKVEPQRDNRGCGRHRQQKIHGRSKQPAKARSEHGRVEYLVGPPYRGREPQDDPRGDDDRQYDAGSGQVLFQFGKRFAPSEQGR